MKDYYVASCSFGKDSTCMLLLLLDNKLPLHEVLFFDTGCEFDEIYSVCNLMKSKCDSLGIKFTIIRSPISLIEMMKINKKWCCFGNRYYTGFKIYYIDKYIDEHLSQYNVIQYLGIAFDEPQRARRLPNNKIPFLFNNHITEKEALEYCYNNGIDFGGLYNYLDRVSCWCCGMKNSKELYNIKKYLPKYWSRLIALEHDIGTYPVYSLEDKVKYYEKKLV